MKTQVYKAFLGFFMGAVLFAGAGVSAAHASSLSQSQIQSIMSLLQSFNVDQSTLSSVYGALTGASITPSPTSGSCLQLQYNLAYGMTDQQSNGEVSKLQTYLGLQPTGYFGSYTRQYVARFQNQRGIQAVGSVGPQTRAALAQLTCGGSGSTVGTTFTLGTPFTIYAGQQSTEVSLGQLNVQLVSVSGSSAQVTLGLNCARGTQCFYYPTQTVTLSTGQQYTFQGYTVMLYSISGSSATFVVTNGSQSSGTSLTASPQSGQAPLVVSFLGRVPSTGNYVIDYGDGTNSGQLNLIYTPCASGSTCYPQVSASHTYLSAGTYTATLNTYIGCLYTNPRCMIAQPAPLATVTITVSGQGSSYAPTISSITPSQGPTGTVVTIYGSGFTNDNTITFGAGGTQHVASSNNGTVITYTIPSQIGPVCTSGAMCPQYLIQVTPNTYNLNVSNANGQSNTVQFTVTSGSQTVGGLTVTSPTTGQVYTRGQDMTISWNYPVTPGSASMVLDLYTAAGSKVGTIEVSNQTIGSYTWHIPGYPQNYMCTMQYPNGLCGTSIPSGQYIVTVSATSNGLDSNSYVYASGQSGVFTINLQ